MDSKQAKEILPILTAFAEGKQIQHRDRNTTENWRDVSNPSFEWSPSHYRIKPEPRVFHAVDWGDRHEDQVDVFDSEEKVDVIINRNRGARKIKLIEVL